MSTAIVLGYILCIPSDYVVNAIPPIERWSWLGGTDVMAQYGIGAGFFLRPIAIYIITWLLCSLIISDVWKDVRSRGLDARRRHRRDAKILGLV